MAYSKAVLICFFSLVVFGSMYAQNSSDYSLDYTLIWEDDFSKSEKEKVSTWLEGVSNAASQCLGKYPFPVEYHIYESTDANEPVPWANTIRDEEQGVNFHIDPNFDLIDFQMDWTAAHEISHLSLPFVGRSNMWFSEGYASFMQWHILRVQGLFSSGELNNIYQTKIELVKRAYSTNHTFLVQSETLKRQHNYPALYWGGACFFMSIDEELREKHNTNLFLVIQKYQTNGRLEDNSLEEVIASLDKISKTTLFSEHLHLFSTKSGNEIISTIQYLPD